MSVFRTITPQSKLEEEDGPKGQEDRAVSQKSSVKKRSIVLRNASGKKLKTEAESQGPALNSDLQDELEEDINEETNEETNETDPYGTVKLSNQVL